MREIKFRAWCINLNEFIQDGFSISQDGLFLYTDDLTEWEITGNFIIEQFTGMHDKNGKEIYFNDLVKAPSGNIFQVIWYDEEMRIAIKYMDTIYNFNVPLYEIIGNIHENPELLK